MRKHRETSEPDRALREWAADRPARKDLQAVERRIVEAWEAELRGTEIGVRPSTPQRTLWGRAARICALTSAALLTAIVLVALLSGPGAGLSQRGAVFPARSVPHSKPDSLQYAQWKEEDLARMLTLCRESQSLFGDRWRWMAETDDRVWLGVSPDTPRTAPHGARDELTLAVRVVVVRRDTGRATWTPVWAMDILARHEEVVRLSADASDTPEAAQVFLWAHFADRDVLAVDFSLSLGGTGLEVTHSGLQQSGVPLLIGVLQRDDGEYRVLQTAAIIDTRA